MTRLMPGSEPTRPTYRRDNDAIWREIRALWARQPAKGQPDREEHEVLFTFSGQPGAGDPSPIYLVRRFQTTITSLSLSAQQPATGISILTLFVNRVVTYEITLPSGDDQIVQDNLLIPVVSRDMVHVSWSVVGTGLSGTVASVVFA